MAASCFVRASLSLGVFAISGWKEGYVGLELVTNIQGAGEGAAYSSRCLAQYFSKKWRDDWLMFGRY